MLYQERNEEKRKAFKQVLEKIEPTSIVYVDESGFNATLIREYGYTRKGQRLMGEQTGKHFKRTSII